LKTYDSETGITAFGRRIIAFRKTLNVFYARNMNICINNVYIIHNSHVIIHIVLKFMQLCS